MKLTIFGATGRTGQRLVEQALQAGHTVTAFARTPAKLGIEHPNLQLVQGDILQPERVAAAVAGAEAVLSALGPIENKPTYQVSRGTQHILTAMQQHGVRRLVISAGAGVGAPGDEPKLFNHLINLLLKLVSKHVYEDMRRTVEIVRQSDRDWTVVRVPMLTDDPPHGNVQVGMVGKGMGPRISRADMAAFMLEQAASESYLRQSPAISN